MKITTCRCAEQHPGAAERSREDSPDAVAEQSTGAGADDAEAAAAAMDLAPSAEDLHAARALTDAAAATAAQAPDAGVPCVEPSHAMVNSSQSETGEVLSTLPGVSRANLVKVGYPRPCPWERQHAVRQSLHKIADTPCFSCPGRYSSTRSPSSAPVTFVSQLTVSKFVERSVLCCIESCDMLVICACRASRRWHARWRHRRSSRIARQWRWQICSLILSLRSAPSVPRLPLSGQSAKRALTRS